MIPIFISCVFFLQVGFNKIISGMTIGIILLASKSLNVKKIINNFFYIIGIIIVLMINKVSNINYPDIYEVVLRSFREVFCASLLILSSKEYITNLNYLKIVGSVGFSMQLFFLGLISLQLLIYTNFGYLLSMPTAYFPFDLNMDLDCYVGVNCLNGLISINDNFRPSGFYSEPSYLAFIIVSVYFACYQYIDKKYNKLFFITTLLISILSKSLSGVFAILIISKFVAKLKYQFQYFLVLILILLFFSDRILNFGNSENDLSSYIRFINPFLAMYEVFTNGYYFGIDPSVVKNFYNSDFGFLDNGFLNLFIFYGVGAFYLIFLIYKKFNYNCLIYIFISSMFNGGIFTLDKAFIISFSVIIYNSYKFYDEPMNKFKIS